MNKYKSFLILGCVIAAGCGGQTVPTAISRDDTSNQCFSEIITPAVIETTIEQREIAPGQFETHSRPEILRERSVTRIELVCPEDQTQTFISSLQRAFRARNLYNGPITGSWTPQTRKALTDFQTVRGINLTTPSLSTARELGLAITPISR
jgi:hypothetical protein